MEDKQHKRLDH